MRRTSHYTVLEVPRNESAHGIRAAYLRLVKRLHPDHAGAASTQAFRDVQTAYDVLSDPVRRRDYDRQLDAKHPARRWVAEPMSPRRRVEPLIPDPPPAFEEMWWRNGPAAGRRRRGSERLTPNGADVPAQGALLELAVVVSPGQAARGGDVVTAVPVRAACPACGGSSLRRPFACTACGHRGWIVREVPLRLHLPAGVRDGTVIAFRRERGVGHDLQVRVLVEPNLRAPPGW